MANEHESALTSYLAGKVRRVISDSEYHCQMVDELERRASAGIEALSRVSELRAELSNTVAWGQRLQEKLHPTFGASCASKRSNASIAERVSDIEASLKELHALRGGEPAQVLSEAEQNQKSLDKIDEWCRKNGGKLEIVSLVSQAHLVLINGIAFSPRDKRSDALAHAAQWCETEMAE